MLPVSLDCPLFCLSSSCVPYVTSFSGLSIVLLVIVFCTLCYQFLWIVHCFACHRFVYPMLPVSLDCPLFCLSSSSVPYVTSFSRLSIVLLVIVLCTLCYQFLWIVHCFACHRLVYPMLPVFLDCPLFCLSSFCVPYVTSFSGLSIVLLVIVLCTLCYQFLWIVHCFACHRLVYPMLPVSLDFPFLIAVSLTFIYLAL
jgi:hypothetical protein